MRDSGAIDNQYSAFIKAIQENKSKTWVLNSSDNPCREYVSVWDRLGTADDNDSTLLTLDIKRLVVPLQARQNILKILHYSHQGISKTYAAARSRYYWPSMKEDITQMTQSCSVCKEMNPKARTNPQIKPEQPKTDLEPFESVGLDMFSWAGKSYLLIVDRMSGYIFVENLAKSALCRTVSQKFKLLCYTYGHPRQVRYDKGPQFGREFE